MLSPMPCWMAGSECQCNQPQPGSHFPELQKHAWLNHNSCCPTTDC